MIVDHEGENFDKRHPFVNLEFVPLSTCQPYLHSYSRPLLKLNPKAHYVYECVFC